MEYRTLGRTGVKVSPLCLGAMMFGSWGNPDHEDSVRIIHRALDAGINFVDTADVYSQGESEEIVGKALAGGRRDDVVLATKVHGVMGKDPNERGNSRRWIIREVEDSLRRLQTDWIDLYQIHRPRTDTDIEETLCALSDLVRAGKVRYIGSSTFPASQIVEAQWVADDRGLERFATEQPPYSILVRGIEADVLPTAQQYGIGVIPWSPLAGGWLSGRYRKNAEIPTSSRAERLPHRFDLSIPGNQRKLDAADALGALADEAGMSLIELALAWVINHPGGDSGDHRAADDGAPRIPAPSRRALARQRPPGPHRRDRAARGDAQPGRRRLRESSARARRPPALSTSPPAARHGGRAAAEVASPCAAIPERRVLVVSMMPLAVGTGVVVIVVAAAVVAVVLIIALSMRGRQTRGAQRREETRRELDDARERAAAAERERDAAQSSVEQQTGGTET